MTYPLLLSAGALAGFIDSIIGGGGLVTVPALMLRVGVSPFAIGTNKIAGAAATLAAAAVYGYNGQMPWKTAARFALWVGLGSILGAYLSPRYLAPFYRVFLWIGTLLCLATVLLKGRLGPKAAAEEGGLSALAAGLGLLCGFYDGAWGPGGGTFMFLALFYATPLGLLGAMAAAKIANLASASFSLVTYACSGYVYWRLGTVFSLSLVAGALAGASLALKHAERVVFPLLLAVTALLLWKLGLSLPI